MCLLDSIKSKLPNENGQTAEQKQSKLPNETLKYLDIVAVNRYAYPRVDGVLVVPIGCLKN